MGCYDDPGGIESGALYVYSGLDGVMLHALCGDAPGDHFGWSVSELGDVNVDGFDDFLVGAPDDDNFAPQSGSAFVYSGLDGTEIVHIEGSWSNSRLGTSVRGVGDLDADGRDEFAIASLKAGASEEGGVRVNGGCDSPAPTAYCTTCANSVGSGALIHASGPLSVTSNGFHLRADALPSTIPGLFFYGADQVAVPLGDGLRCVGGVFGVHRLDVVVSSVTGDVDQHFDFNAFPASSGPGQVLPGSTWNSQYWYRDVAAGGAGFNLSNAMQATFCP